MVNRATDELDAALSDARMRALVEGAGQAWWTADAGGGAVEPQPAWQAFTGQTAAEVLANGGFGWVEAIHPDDRGEMVRSYRDAIARGARYERQTRVRRPDGRGGIAWHPTLIRAVPVRPRSAGGGGRAAGEWVGSGTDVTDLVAAQDAAESALAESEARFRLLADALPEVVWTATPDGRLDYVSWRFAAFTGMAPHRALGIGWLELVHPDDRDRSAAAWGAAVAAGAPYAIEHRVRRADGGYLWSLTVARPLRDTAGAVTMWAGSATDVTERKQAEAERERLLANAEADRAAAEAANAAKGGLLAAASHDLRAPLVTIAGYAELLDEGVYGPVTPAQRAALANITRAHEHLLGLISDILTAARDANPAPRPRGPAEAPLGALCARLDALLAPQAAARGLRFTCDAHDPATEGELVARADPGWVLRILVNLVANAIRYTAAPGEVGVEVRAEGEWVVVRVRDTGPGIAADQREAIFEPFMQGDPTVAAQEGVGLGLATSRDLARRMGGDVTVESTVEAGSTFTLTLPRAGVR